jgi:DNA replication protein DnaC
MGEVVEMPTATVEQRPCVECGATFEFESAGESSLARLANTFRRHCDDCADRLETAERRAEAESAHRRRIATSGLPADLADVTFDRLGGGGDTRPLAAARRWAAGELRGLFLCGPIGVGKTTLAAAATNQRLRDRGVRWALVPSLVAQSFGDDRAKAQAAAILTGTGALVLDDLDKVKAGEWVAAQLFSAIDSRITAGAPLLVTTNKDVGEIAAKFGGDFGDSIASRLVGYCGSDGMHEMRGPDRRLGS